MQESGRGRKLRFTFKLDLPSLAVLKLCADGCLWRRRKTSSRPLSVDVRQGEVEPLHMIINCNGEDSHITRP